MLCQPGVLHGDVVAREALGGGGQGVAGAARRHGVELVSGGGDLALTALPACRLLASGLLQVV